MRPEAASRPSPAAYRLWLGRPNGPCAFTRLLGRPNGPVALCAFMPLLGRPNGLHAHDPPCPLCADITVRAPHGAPYALI